MQCHVEVFFPVGLFKSKLRHLREIWSRDQNLRRKTKADVFVYTKTHLAGDGKGPETHVNRRFSGFRLDSPRFASSFFERPRVTLIVFEWPRFSGLLGSFHYNRRKDPLRVTSTVSGAEPHVDHRVCWMDFSACLTIRMDAFDSFRQMGSAGFRSDSIHDQGFDTRVEWSLFTYIRRLYTFQGMKSTVRIGIR